MSKFSYNSAIAFNVISSSYLAVIAFPPRDIFDRREPLLEATASGSKTASDFRFDFLAFVCFFYFLLTFSFFLTSFLSLPKEECVIELFMAVLRTSSPSSTTILGFFIFAGCFFIEAMLGARSEDTFARDFELISIVFS